MHPADVFPIIFLTAVIIQGTILIGISVGESRSILQECKTIAQVVWPGKFVAEDDQGPSLISISLMDCPIYYLNVWVGNNVQIVTTKKV